MRLGINLRSDLKKLAVDELRAELDRMIEYRWSRFDRSPSVGSMRGIFARGDWPFGRGPIHARLAYRIQIGYFWFFRGPRGTQYLVECEIKDLRDEIARRAKVRTVSPWATR